ncbi:hypothetical protein B0H10DRAFT_1940708 [Mycena sp. CBHHK59/15]|nr:hypothetical protein B0H10DRAFT_1940708 [Mycena sp. CBHHK59/15]
MHLSPLPSHLASLPHPTSPLTLTDLLPTVASAPGRVGLLELAPVWGGACLLSPGLSCAWEKTGRGDVLLLHTRQWGSPANGFGKRPAAVYLTGRRTGMLATEIVVQCDEAWRYNASAVQDDPS